MTCHFFCRVLDRVDGLPDSRRRLQDDSRDKSNVHRRIKTYTRRGSRRWRQIAKSSETNSCNRRGFSAGFESFCLWWMWADGCWAAPWYAKIYRLTFELPVCYFLLLALYCPRVPQRNKTSPSHSSRVPAFIPSFIRVWSNLIHFHMFSPDWRGVTLLPPPSFLFSSEYTREEISQTKLCLRESVLSCEGLPG